MLIVIIRSFILYFAITAAVRLMGKRQIGELQPSELVITMLLSNIATLPVEDISIPMTMGIVPIFTKILISDGKIDRHAMHELRFTTDDLMAALRSQQIFDINDVQFAVAETTGTISVCPKKSASPPSAVDLGIKVENSDPPVMVISDGEVSRAALDFLGLDKEWLKKVVKAKGAEIGDVFIMTAENAAKYTVIKKEDDI